ncbi:MAG: sulfite exporter TauE/SafE family protein [Acidobacteriota bacterium]|nr:sulfite exporter TauE/SafE family protein [Acidobacteriota bacterium]
MNSILIISIGILAGIFSGLFGIGGGIVMVPAMVMLANFPLIKATGTSLAAILLPVGIFGVIAYYRAKLIDIRGSILIAVGLAMSVMVGAWLAHALPATIVQKLYALFCLYVSWTFVKPVNKFRKYFGQKKRGQQKAEEASAISASVRGKVADESKASEVSPGLSEALLVASVANGDGAQAAVKATSEVTVRAGGSGGSDGSAGASAAAAAIASEPPCLKPHFLALVGVGLIAGVMSGMFGIGGGNVIVPFLILFLRYPVKRAIATSLGALLAPVGLPGVIYYYKAGTLDLRVAGLLAIGLVAGTVVGARLNIRISGELVKVLYGLFLIFVALRFLL